MSVTGLRTSSMQNLVLNEGAFLVGFDYSSYATAEALEVALISALQDGSKLLGATNGGGTFVCVPTTRQIEIDGIRGSVKGATHVDSWDIRLTGTLKELKKETFAKLLMCADVDTSVSDITKITLHNDIEATDYIANLCWVGSTPYGYILIGMTDVLNTAGVTMTFADKDEATIPFEFSSHSNSLVGDDDLPVEVIFLTAESETFAPITIVSAAGTSSGYTDLTLSGYTPGAGESYVYKIGENYAPTIPYKGTPDYTWTPWDGDDEIEATNGYKIAVISVDGNSKAIAYGSATVVSAT